MSKDGRTWLSHTAIESVDRCPRCFWLSQKKKIKQPEGIQSRLANRFDKVLKNYFDGFRGKDTLPPLIDHVLSGRLQNPFVETYFHTINDKYGFLGKLDECLVNEDGALVPVDFKTASSDPREKEILGAYQHQIDEYVFLQQQNKLKTAGFGYLIFFYPDLSETIHDGFPMITKVEKVTANPESVMERINKAISILENDMPESSPECPFCSWFVAVKDFYIK